MRKKVLGRPLRGRGPTPRSHCPIAYALAFVGDRWTLLVLRDLIMARKRYFQEFLDSDEKIASNILASRLKLLEAAGLATRAPDPASARRTVYTATDKAMDLLPAMLELVRWSAKYDARTLAPPPLVRRIADDRDGFVAEIRSHHKK
ncbi:MAG: winged helix-turn-helix transcriptional regulator [Nevskiaceae bacterium]